jgi:L-ascorbate metabolism protein UlaG (beta-lactamase superfamily)
LRRFLLLVLTVLGGLGIGLVFLLHSRPSIEAYARYQLPANPPAAPTVTASFLGVSTILFSDGETAILTDGFFTRPGPALSLLLGAKVEPDREAIDRALERAAIDRLAAVAVLHSHYDHAMDAPIVAERTGAMLLGSSSTANIARGLGLPEDRMVVVESGKPLAFGRFTVTMVRSRHIALLVTSSILGTKIESPLVPPASVYDYAEGETYSAVIAHPLGTVLVQSSAGYAEGALDKYKADVVMLGVGGLGRTGTRYKEAYFNQVVEAVRATRIIPIHYDDFTLPFEEPVQPFPWLADDVRASLDYLIRRTEADDMLRMEMLPPWKPVVLFG